MHSPRIDNVMKANFVQNVSFLNSSEHGVKSAMSQRRFTQNSYMNSNPESARSEFLRRRNTV